MYRDTVWFREEIEVKRVKFLTNCEAGLQRCPALLCRHTTHVSNGVPNSTSLSLRLTLTTPDGMEDPR